MWPNIDRQLELELELELEAVKRLSVNFVCCGTYLNAPMATTIMSLACFEYQAVIMYHYNRCRRLEISLNVTATF